MYIAFFVSFDAVLSFCFVKYDLSLCAGLCATSMLKGRNNLQDMQDMFGVSMQDMFVCMQVQYLAIISCNKYARHVWRFFRAFHPSLKLKYILWIPILDLDQLFHLFQPSFLTDETGLHQ
jgi:hypothetical protein